MVRVLDRAFFDRSTLVVAEELLGKQLCRRLQSGKVISSRIVETEAYDGFEDKASHAHKGITPRNAVMFGPPGRAYVYLCYGLHWLLNVTTREEGYPAATLIRSVEDAKGPGRTTKHFQVNGTFNDQLLVRANRLWVEDDGFKPTAPLSTSRIGIDYAGSKWSQMPWRFISK